MLTMQFLMNCKQAPLGRRSPKDAIMTAKTTLALLPRGGWLLALALLLIGGVDRIASAQAPASGEPARVELSGVIGKVGRGGIEVSADSVREVDESGKKPKTKAKAAPKTATE